MLVYLCRIPNTSLLASNSCFDFLRLRRFMWTISVFQCDEKIYKITSLTFLCNQIVHVKTFYSWERQETLEWKERRALSGFYFLKFLSSLYSALMSANSEIMITHVGQLGQDCKNRSGQFYSKSVR